jgi:hypothetical protein
MLRGVVGNNYKMALAICCNAGLSGACHGKDLLQHVKKLVKAMIEM